jgi:hypothetical protein
MHDILSPEIEFPFSKGHFSEFARFLSILVSSLNKQEEENVIRITRHDTDAKQTIVTCFGSVSKPELKSTRELRH